MTMETYQVRDGARLLTFEGEILARSSSARPSAPRWTELALYRTKQGTYIVGRIGRSMVVHAPECESRVPHLPLFVDEYPDKDPDGFVTWHSCIGVDDVYDLGTLLVEKTRYEAIICETPADVIEALSSRQHGVRSLPRIAIELLEQATEADSSLSEEFLTEHVS